MAGDPYKYFRIEAREIAEQLGTCTLELERGAPTQQVVAQVLRLAHTLKGAARVVKQREIADLSHAIEGALEAFRDGAARVPADIIQGLLEKVDAIGVHVAALALPAERAVPEQRAAPAAVDDSFRTMRADVEEMDRLLDGIAEVSVQLAPLRRAVGTLERARRLTELLGDQLALRDRRTPAAALRTHSFADDLRELVEGLEHDLGTAVGQVDRELHQVREAAERLRLLPARSMASQLERTARDTAQAIGVRARFEMSGGEIRLDTHVISTVQQALVQMVRNAVAHGIEPELERARSGKPSEGRISIEVSRRGSRVVFVCRDDGRGVDVEAVRRAAVRKGISAAQAAALGVDQLLALALRGGITTTGSVTEVAGRGIGLDVVRDAGERLGGEVSVRTERGQGTALELVVPVSMASLDVLVVDAGGQTSAIPLDAVKRTLHVAAGDIARTPTGSSITYAGQVIPFRPLARSLRAHEPHIAARGWSTVVIASGTGLAAVGVDRLRGTDTIVVRPLPELAPADAVVSGASLDTEGNPRLVLDPDALVADAHRGGEIAAAVTVARLPVLVVDDSLTTRMLEQSILESAGYIVEVAASAEEALEKASRTSYLLFLVDVEMPGMDGFSFIERVRADPALRDIPAILVTSRASAEDRRRGEAVGARAYIVKGEFDQGELLDRIRVLVGGR